VTSALTALRTGQFFRNNAPCVPATSILTVIAWSRGRKARFYCILRDRWKKLRPFPSLKTPLKSTGWEITFGVSVSNAYSALVRTEHTPILTKKQRKHSQNFKLQVSADSLKMLHGPWRSADPQMKPLV